VVSIDDNGAAITVDGTVGVSGTVAVTQSGTWDEVGINDSGNSITVDWAGTAPPIGAGLEATALRVTIATNSTGVLSVDDNGSSLTVDAPVGTPAFVRLSDGSAAITTLPVSLASVPSHAVTNAGTFATQVDGAALTALQLIDDPVFADDAAFTPATSKVMAVGFEADDTSTDLVDEGDIGAARMTLDRRLIVQLGESGVKDVVGGGTKTDTTDQEIMAASAGLYNVLTWATFYNSSATNTFALIKDGATTRAVVPIPAYGGAIFQPARGLRSTVNTAINFASGASVTTAYLYGGGYRTAG
jgi:hypothetical protein